MAHIDDRWMRRKRGPDGKFLFGPAGKPVMERDPARFGKGKRWRVRYLPDPTGKERNHSFEKKVDAENFMKEVDADILRGTYVDPQAGKITFRKLAEEVIENRTLDPSTREVMKTRLSKHVYPVIGGKEIGRLSQRPSMIQTLVKSMDAHGLAATYIATIMTHVGTVFAVAIDDGLVAKNPVKTSTVVLPKVTRKKLVPWTAGQVVGMGDALPGRYQATVEVGAGLGMRQGEILAFSPDDVDWLRGFVKVRRQIKILGSKLVFALPKYGKVREVPLAETVKLTLSEHMREYEPLKVTLPWKTLDGEAHTVRLFFSCPGNAYGGAIYRDRINELWHAALDQVGIVPAPPKGVKRGHAYRDHGMHMLRHYFASSLLTEGESIQAVAEWLGHTDLAITLRYYAHLMPKSEQRMRTLIDRALRQPTEQDHGPGAAQGATT